MQKYRTIELQVSEAGLANIVLARPEVNNAMNQRMIDEFTDVFMHLKKVGKIRFICIKSSGKHFCSGADLKWMKASKEASYNEIHEGSLRLYNLFNTISKIDIPVISAVKGAVFGGGLGLLAVSDYVIAESNSQFCFSELKLGLLPATISPFVIKKIGYSAANALFLSARKFDADYALSIGLVHQISESFEPDLHDLLEGFSLTAPMASSQCKEMARQIDDGLSDPKNFTSGLITNARMSSEAAEGISALFEKRKAAWVKRKK